MIWWENDDEEEKNADDASQFSIAFMVRALGSVFGAVCFEWVSVDWLVSSFTFASLPAGKKPASKQRFPRRTVVWKPEGRWTALQTAAVQHILASRERIFRGGRWFLLTLHMFCRCIYMCHVVSSIIRLLTCSCRLMFGLHAPSQQ